MATAIGDYFDGLAQSNQSGTLTAGQETAHVLAQGILGAAVAAAGDNNAFTAGLAAGASEAAAPILSNWLYGTSDPEQLTADQKSTLTNIASLAGIGIGATTGNGADIAAGSQLAENAVENNALSATDAKQRQDAQWELDLADSGLLSDEDNALREQIIDDLNAKDQAFDEAINAACQSLSSAQCLGLRTELETMGESYDQLVDGAYLETYRSIYGEGAEDVDGLLWEYATADAEAKREADIQWIAQNNGISEGTAEVLYDLMRGAHATAAVAGSIYGLSGIKTPSKATSSTIEYPEGIHFDKNLQNHLAQVDDFSQKKGISGGHNLDNFMAELTARGGRIVSETPTGIDGITQIKYEIPAFDRTGQVIGYKTPSSNPKTVYDPTKFSDSQMLEMGQQAAAQGYAKNGMQYTETVNGIKFRVYIDENTGAVRSVHPE